jgi:predicted  nucleic acid-binding Zn-ribbon protein
MNLSAQLNKLQQIDLEIQRKRQKLNEIQSSSDDKALLTVKSELNSWQQQLSVARKEQKDTEWELEDLEAKAKQFGHKLYSGTTKNPKELASLESEVKLLESKIRRKEDELLQLMSQVEEMEAQLKTCDQKFQEVQQEWQQSQETVGQAKAALENELIKLEEIRRGLAEPIPVEIVALYEQVKLVKGLAVVRVEQGRCQGCHITLPTSQWQRVKAGDLVQCNSCSRIMCVE